jgi:hypothetical protein
MTSHNPAHSNEGISLRQAALIAGLGLLVMTFAAPFAEFLVFKNMIVRGDIQATAQNILDKNGLFLAGIFAYLLVFIMDIVVAWALYVLFIPVNRSFALLTAWFRLVYTAVVLVALFKLVTVWRLLNTPDYAVMFGQDQLLAQVKLLLNTFRYEMGFGLILFGIYLLMLAWLVFRSTYVPKILALPLVIAGLGWIIYEVVPFFVPGIDLGLLFIAFMGELVFMVWLLVRGWKIQEPGRA